MDKKFTIVSMKREKKNVEMLIRDDSTRKEIKIIIPNEEIPDIKYVVGVSDTPESGQEKKAQGKDGKTYWVKLAEEQKTDNTLSILEPTEEWEKRVMELVERPDLPPYKQTRIYSAYEAAKIAERSGRYEDAAKAYEMLALDIGDEKMLDKAKMLRAKAQNIGQVKVITMDLNALIQQLRRDGLVVAYRCPHCGGNIKISGETKLESLKFCSYCGSRIETIDLIDFLKSIL